MTNEKDQSKKSVDDTEDLWRLDPHEVDLYIEEMHRLYDDNSKKVEKSEEEKED